MNVMDPNLLFRKMYNHYGDQNWWPGEGFEIAIGAILTQNTSWSNVEKALANMRSNNLLTPLAIVQCEEANLLEQIRPAGFFNQKAKYLKNLSKLWMTNSTPSRDELLAVNGVGPETADSILLYLLNQPEFVIDAYTIRISKRLGIASFSNYKDWKSFYEESIEKNLEIYNNFHALFVVHAKNFCKKNNPLCKQCFLNGDCQYIKNKS